MDGSKQGISRCLSTRGSLGDGTLHLLVSSCDSSSQISSDPLVFLFVNLITRSISLSNLVTPVSIRSPKSDPRLRIEEIQEQFLLFQKRFEEDLLEWLRKQRPKTSSLFAVLRRLSASSSVCYALVPSETLFTSGDYR